MQNLGSLTCIHHAACTYPEDPAGGMRSLSAADSALSAPEVEDDTQTLSMIRRYQVNRLLEFQAELRF